MNACVRGQIFCSHLWLHNLIKNVYLTIQQHTHSHIFIYKYIHLQQIHTYTFGKSDIDE